MNRFLEFYRGVSRNDTRQCWVLKCDIRKFFANIDHGVMLDIIGSYTQDQNLLWLAKEILDSFSVRPGVGVPLGNLTSQLFVNVYMNEFDQFVKHKLKARHYVRYADDFIVLSPNREWLEIILPEIGNFLANCLHLQLHPKKVSIATFSSGIDFLGWVHFPDHRVLRTTTKLRMLKRIKTNPVEATIASYRGLLTHGNAYQIGKMFNLGRKLDGLTKPPYDAVCHGQALFSSAQNTHWYSTKGRCLWKVNRYKIRI
jgi:hypothetical protein